MRTQTHPATSAATPAGPQLTFVRIPHWGWRAVAAGHRYEIERLVADDNRGKRYRAFVRRPGTTPPIASLAFGTTITARAWLEQQHAIIAAGLDTRLTRQGRA